MNIDTEITIIYIQRRWISDIHNWAEMW